MFIIYCYIFNRFILLLQTCDLCNRQRYKKYMKIYIDKHQKKSLNLAQINYIK